MVRELANREGRRRRERETRSDRFRVLSVELSRLASTPFASSIDGRALRARARPRSSPERRRPPSLVRRTGTRAPRGALEKLGVHGAYLLLSFSPGNSGYSFASGGAVGSDMVGFAVSFTGGETAFTGSGAGFGTDEGSGGVGSCCLESFPPIGEWRHRVR